MAGFLALIFILGFYIGIIIFLFAYVKIKVQIGWLPAALVSGALWFFIYFVFGKIMELELFKGILMGEILPPL